MKKPNNKIRGVKAYGYGILNAFGEFWTPQTFFSEQAAQNHIDEFGSKYKSDMSLHKVIPVIITPLLKRKPLKTK